LSALQRRLAALETTKGRQSVVHQYVGMSKDDAMLLRFGPGGALAGATLIFAVNSLPPAGVPYRWATNKESPDYPTH
jgi:hypothetical protein